MTRSESDRMCTQYAAEPSSLLDQSGGEAERKGSLVQDERRKHSFTTPWGLARMNGRMGGRMHGGVDDTAPTTTVQVHAYASPTEAG